MGQHRRRLAEAHVEREASAEPGGIEEPDPGHRLGLIRAQLAVETLRLGDRRHRHFAGAAHDVVGPAVAVNDDAARERRPAEADALAQDLRTGELGDAFAFGERCGGLLHVEPIDLDPAAARLHERAGLPGEPPDLVGGQLDVVEQHRPRDVAELVGADGRPGGRLGEQSQRWPWPCDATAQAAERRSRRSPASGRRRS